MTPLCLLGTEENSHILSIVLAVKIDFYAKQVLIKRYDLRLVIVLLDKALVGNNDVVLNKE